MHNIPVPTAIEIEPWRHLCTHATLANDALPTSFLSQDFYEKPALQKSATRKSCHPHGYLAIDR